MNNYCIESLLVEWLGSSFPIQLAALVHTLLDFHKVLRTISSGSQGSGALLVARSRLRRSVYSVYFWCFCPFQFFIVPIYRIITKNISESTCGKSNTLSTL